MKKLSLILILFFLLCGPSFADRIPVKIELNQTISTEIDNTYEVGDEIEFKTVNNVYKNGEIIINKGTPVYGVIDFTHDNGWIGDSAEIDLKNFILKTNDNKKITVYFPVKIDRQDNTENKKKNLKSLKALILSIFRGNELNIEPKTMSFNIIIDE